MRSTLNRSQDGYILIMALLITALISITGLMISDNINLLMKSSHQGRIEMTIQNIRDRAMAAVYNKDAWSKQTALGDTCMLTGDSCNEAQALTPFVLKDITGDVVVSNADSAGFTSKGTACTGYSTGGNDSCPIRLMTSWRPVNCNAGKCMIEVTGEFTFASQTDNTLRMLKAKNFDFRVIRGREDGSLQNSCITIGGSFNQAQNTCTVQSFFTTCPAGQYLVQANNFGPITCRPFLGYGPVCQTGSAAVGVKDDGSIDCRSNLDWVGGP